jgi:hypothetical protein
MTSNGGVVGRLRGVLVVLAEDNVVDPV